MGVGSGRGRALRRLAKGCGNTDLGLVGLEWRCMARFTDGRTERDLVFDLEFSSEYLC